MMNQEEIFNLSFANQERAKRVLMSSDIANVWEQNGCRVNLIGSLRMGLLASHKDIDFHVYSKDITEESSFAIAAQIAKLPMFLKLSVLTDFILTNIALHGISSISMKKIYGRLM